MRYGTAAWGFRELPLEKRLEITKNAGLTIHELGIENAPTDVYERQEYFLNAAREIVLKLEETAGRKLTCCVNTFGCQMNARDSEKILGILERVGYEETDSEKADFVIYNTCTVRENANNKVYGRLGYLGNYKKKNPNMKIALCGCMMQEANVQEKIKKSYHFVDLVFGTHNIFCFAELLTQALLSEHTIIDIWESNDKIVEELPISRKYAFISGYLRHIKSRRSKRYKSV